MTFEMNDERREIAAKLGVTEEEYMAEAQRAMRGFGMAPVKAEGAPTGFTGGETKPESFWSRVTRAWAVLWDLDSGW